MTKSMLCNNMNENLIFCQYTFVSMSLYSVVSHSVKKPTKKIEKHIALPYMRNNLLDKRRNSGPQKLRRCYGIMGPWDLDQITVNSYIDVDSNKEPIQKSLVNNKDDGQSNKTIM